MDEANPKDGVLMEMHGNFDQVGEQLLPNLKFYVVGFKNDNGLSTGPLTWTGKDGCSHWL